ncbi:MAG: Asp-tRNA(Asn)/Glu-tRNA(Gln) amidotransferase subunit GatB, partial [Candidatus Curtissbacteria bacterium]|nr:Asp-tRNA(Asn)/Glu-tRNA(Gln) amidotransferase subunit GatB [Candidatus Curtissbacteria bacterium]
VIGLEVHVELYTKSKMFCTCSADYFGKEPNTHTCPVCLGLPGALPTPNKQAIDWCVEIGLALGCKISNSSKFDRKNYFYPDLAKGYQISQYDLPFCNKGEITLESGKKIRITRVHMEEDTGKLTHATVEGKNVSLIDFNRSGVPLVEIVTEPDFENAQEVVVYLKKLQQTIRYLRVSSADMEKGDMRLEPNISLRKKGQNGLPNYKVEVKNINSFRFVEKAINFEIDRQSELLNSSKTPAQETRGWNEQKNATVSQRSKEEAHDYRYFPEPDLPPIEFKNEYIEKIKAFIGELPDTKLERFKRDFGLNDYDAEILTREIGTADYFEEALEAGKETELSPKQVANIIINKKPDITKILPATLVKNYIAENQTAQIDESQLEKAIDEVISENRKAVEDYIGGKQNILMFLVGSVMKKIATKIDANLVKSKLLEKLK